MVAVMDTPVAEETKLRRITPDEVLDAYEKTGMRPMAGQYESYGGDPEQVFGCGLGAMMRAGLDIYDADQLDQFYRVGFAQGFDFAFGESTPKYRYSHVESWAIGFADGVMTAGRVKEVYGDSGARATS